ncbi:ATP-binding protein [Desulfosediminicola ganghwensis]|uniref:ATP-binding protein n=1 Tax=Desulfosediminicola ganghwensis TaxID=2569540 RepID=UPI0010ACE2F2|nr:ATP-binding protein [Desulfosediminicola ganghwensis]
MRFSLRIKLTLVALLLLIIPLIGFRFSEIITRDLVESREETLLFSARSVASALAGRTGLLDQELFHSLNQSRDLYLFQLTNPIRLNGKSDDWMPQLLEAEAFAEEHLLRSTVPYRYDSLHFKHMLGVRGEYVYAIFIVTDDKVIYRPPHSLGIARADHLQIGIEDQNGKLHRYVVSTTKPGWVNGYLMPENPADSLPIKLERRIQGVWAETLDGYVIELRIPRDLIGDRFAFAIADVDDPVSREVTTLIGTANPESPEKLGWLLSPSKTIESILSSLDRPQSRILIVDSNQRVRASHGNLNPEAEQPDIKNSNLIGRVSDGIFAVLEPLYKLFTTPFTDEFKTPVAMPTTLDISGVKEALQGKESISRYRIAEGQVEIMAAIAPLTEDRKIVGAVVVEQTTNSILALQNKVIEESLSFSILAFCIGGFGLLFFASRLSSRIRLLRNQAAGAITDTGQINNTLQPSRARDEIGDLSRTLNSMLHQLKEQSDYRETMADNLEHEMRTPLAGISASLKNISGEIENPPERIRNYLEWALSDVMRLEQLLGAIRDATSLQEALNRDTHEVFNLHQGMQVWLEHSWRPAFPETEFIYQHHGQDIMVLGDPGHIRQLLDKLIENGVSFHAEGTAIEIGLGLSISEKEVILTVANQGPTIAEEMRGQIFNTMVSRRAKSDTKPHLGLGLYVARTITVHHGGTISVNNLTDGRTGVVFTIQLPLVQ